MPPIRLLALPIGAALALAAPLPAGAADTDPVVVPNATFSSPTVPDGQSWVSGVDGWTGPSGVGSSSRAAHPKGFQAATLGWNGKAVALSTRLRGVRAGATVTLTWDDNPDSCVTSGAAPRTYTVTVAGPANPVGNFTTKPPAGKADWFIGRTYSFTAAEDAPEVTFTNTATSNPGCGEMITNLTATQTPPPAEPPTNAGKSDPCAGDQANSPACTTNAGNKEKMDKCPATSRDCLDSVAGKGEKENAGIDQQTQALADFTSTPREQDPNAALGGLCQVANLHTENLEPGDTVLAPGTWWYC
ncbi:hypothetical protein Kpho02_63860 [Kitasatospora phosalacinea]|uniref:Uncharacterized protein n=1 Tax=Kitasatospora phosalacinea TaxID=2065 RepID=A0A9W6V5A1_9ACTN|nr:hypothetical protein [Kitasatospora phosalacinea]GLW74088.1 hypothetical protein Kpho02_63860 [Kitasatospora phosalacinea]